MYANPGNFMNGVTTSVQIRAFEATGKNKKGQRVTIITMLGLDDEVIVWSGDLFTADSLSGEWEYWPRRHRSTYKRLLKWGGAEEIFEVPAERKRDGSVEWEPWDVVRLYQLRMHQAVTAVRPAVNKEDTNA